MQRSLKRKTTRRWSAMAIVQRWAGRVFDEHRSENSALASGACPKVELSVSCREATGRKPEA